MIEKPDWIFTFAELSTVKTIHFIYLPDINETMVRILDQHDEILKEFQLPVIPEENSWLANELRKNRTP